MKCYYCRRELKIKRTPDGRVETRDIRSGSQRCPDGRGHAILASRDIHQALNRGNVERRE